MAKARAAAALILAAACGGAPEKPPLCLPACHGGGTECCRGMAFSTVPQDGRYVLTTFGGADETARMSCGGDSDGKWWYVADRQRFGCGAVVRIENPRTGACVHAKVADYGPGTCVESAACGPVLDASPLVAKQLFGVARAGWSERRTVVVTKVAPTTRLGPCRADGGGIDPATQPGGGPREAPTRIWLWAFVATALLAFALWPRRKRRRRRR